MASQELISETSAQFLSFWTENVNTWTFSSGRRALDIESLMFSSPGLVRRHKKRSNVWGVGGRGKGGGRKEKRKSLQFEGRPSFTVMIHQRKFCQRYETDERHAMVKHNGNSSIYPDPVTALSSITGAGSQRADRPGMSPSGCRCCGALSPTESSGAEDWRGRGRRVGGWVEREWRRRGRSYTPLKR